MKIPYLYVARCCNKNAGRLMETIVGVTRVSPRGILHVDILAVLRATDGVLHVSSSYGWHLLPEGFEIAKLEEL